MKNYLDPNRDLRAILHPYVFVLEEGKSIKDNLFDYSLLMVHVNTPEILRSPGAEKSSNFQISTALLSEHVTSDNKQDLLP